MQSYPQIYKKSGTREILVTMNSSQFRNQMPYGCPGMNEYHARTYILHHFTYATALLRRITMYLTLPATCLMLTFRAMVEPLMRITQQCAAVIAQLLPVGMMMATAIYSNHLSDHLFLQLNFVHRLPEVRLLSIQ